MKTKDIIIPIRNITCGSCISKINDLFRNNAGIYSIKSNIFTKEIKIKYDEGIIKKSYIFQELRRNGFIVGCNKAFKEIPVISLFNYLVIHMAHSHRSLLCVFVLIQVYLFENLKRRSGPIFSLVFLSSFISFLFGCFIVFVNYGEAIVYLRISNVLFTFLMLGRLIEDVIKQRNMRSVNEKRVLAFNEQDEYTRIDKSISAACREKNNIESTVRVHDIRVNDFIVVERDKVMPVDGQLVSDHAFFDEQLLSGESVPVYKHHSDKVFAGTRNVYADCIVRVTRVQKDTLQGEILSFLSKSHFQKENPNISTFNRFVAAYSIVTLVTHYIIYLAGIKPLMLYQNEAYPFIVPVKIFVTIFIVACPCAISLCEPLLFLASSNLLLKNGVLIRNAKTMKRRVNMIVFDKTGTLTDGFMVKDITNCLGLVSYDKKNNESIIRGFIYGMGIQDIYHVLCVIQTGIEHPVAKCLFRFLSQKIEHCRFHYKLTRCDYAYLPGSGIDGCIAVDYISNNNDDPERLNIVFNIRREGLMYHLVLDGILTGKIEVTEKLRDGCFELISSLITQGYRVSILSGDSAESVKQISKSVGIDKYLYNQTMQDKLEYITQAQSEGNGVMMIGDGMNDILALRKADVGISFKTFNNNTPVSILNEKIANVLLVLKTAKAVQKRMGVCYFISFLYNSIALIIVSGVLIPFNIYVDPEKSCFSMFFSFLCVVLISISV